MINNLTSLGFIYLFNLFLNIWLEGKVHEGLNLFLVQKLDDEQPRFSQRVLFNELNHAFPRPFFLSLNINLKALSIRDSTFLNRSSPAGASVVLVLVPNFLDCGDSVSPSPAEIGDSRWEVSTRGGKKLRPLAVRGRLRRNVRSRLRGRHRLGGSRG